MAPDGSEITPATRPQPDGTLSRRAWPWHNLLDEGVCASLSEIGEAENFSKSYASRILRLALLAPDVVESILAGQASQAVLLDSLERPLLARWDEQRQRFS